MFVNNFILSYFIFILLFTEMPEHPRRRGQRIALGRREQSPEENHVPTRKQRERIRQYFIDLIISLCQSRNQFDVRDEYWSDNLYFLLSQVKRVSSHQRFVFFLH